MRIQDRQITVRVSSDLLNKIKKLNINASQEIREFLNKISSKSSLKYKRREK